MIGAKIKSEVERQIHGYSGSLLSRLFQEDGPYVIKFVQSRWAATYETPSKLKVSDTPALTWGTATYVTPINFPLSSALYGRIGLVTKCDPASWRIFDATTIRGQRAYVRWARSQPMYADLLLTVHSTQANHFLRNQFRERFEIDCVLFHPDQEAESHTDRVNHIWMAVTDWAADHTIERGMSQRLSRARFTVLIDEEFRLMDQGLPIQVGERQIERVTERMFTRQPTDPENVTQVRGDPRLPATIVQTYQGDGYLHVYIEP